MPVEIVPLSSPDQYREAFGPLGQVFSFGIDDEWLERDKRLHPYERMLVAREDGRVVGSAGAFPFAVTVPGGAELPASGVTWVAVLPTHRRRGVMRAMIERQLADCRERGEPLAVLWASEGSIYGRFGYGIATVSCDVEIERDRAVFTSPLEPIGRVRLLTLEEAADAFPPIYDRVRAETAGMHGRSPVWWADKTLVNPDYSREDEPLRFAVLAQNGGDEGYAMYRIRTEWHDGGPASTLTVVEALATTPGATQELWRYLFGIDLVARIRARRLPPDHPLYLALAEPARLRMRMGDGLWLRLVDLEEAFRARSLRAGEPVVAAVADPQCPWNEGSWRLGPDGAMRTEASPELRLGAAELGCAYLGQFTLAQLAWAGRVEELEPGAVARADALLRTDRAPWCPEVF